MRFRIAIVLGCALVLTGCTPIEKQAYKIIVGAKAFIDAEKKIHAECATSTSPLCGNLQRATAAKDALIDAAEVYCSGPQFEAGGACQPPAKGTPAATQAIAKLKAAMAAYEQTEKDVKGAL